MSCATEYSSAQHCRMWHVAAYLTSVCDGDGDGEATYLTFISTLVNNQSHRPREEKKKKEADIIPPHIHLPIIISIYTYD